MGLCDDAREKILCLCGLQFPKTREGDFPTKDEKCLASNGMTCVLPLSPIYTVTSFVTAKDIWDYIRHPKIFLDTISVSVH